MEGRVYDVAAQLLECVCLRLGDRCPDRKCIIPGLEVPFDNCCAGDRGGQLTINVSQRFPSREFPAIATTVPENCLVPFLVTVYNVSIVRCAPVGSATSGPTCPQLDESAKGLFLDMERVWSGVACCLSDKETMKTLVGAVYTYSLGTMTSIGPEGDCVGFSFDAAVGMDPCLECP